MFAMRTHPTDLVAGQLNGWGRHIGDPRVLKAMSKVPRHEFVLPEFRSQAYEDHPLPIGYGQTISQPYIVAFMTEQLELRPSDRVLEIGTGCGYQTAVLAELAAEIYSLEIVPELASRATRDLRRLGYCNIHTRPGDGFEGWPEAAPFDGIIATCAPERVPQPLIDQLRDGGRMIIPVGPPGEQALDLIWKCAGTLARRTVLPVRFVPMTGRAAKH